MIIQGYPLAPSNPVYSPTDRLLRQSPSYAGNDRSGHVGQEPLTAQSQPSFLAGIPNEQEDLTKLMREALTTKEHARVLQSALAHVKPSKLSTDPIIQVSKALDSMSIPVGLLKLLLRRAGILRHMRA